ncbi:MAG: Hint domain-containing protein [Pseudooceanicola sp.]
MATYSFTGYAISSIVIGDGDPNVTVGDYIAIDPYFDATTDALSFEVTDGDTTYHPTSADATQPTIVRDAGGATLISGQSAPGYILTLSDGNGTTVQAYLVYVDGALAGLVSTSAVTPGVQWQITAITTYSTSNDIEYGAIVDADHDPADADSYTGGAYDDTFSGGGGGDILDFSAGGANVGYGGSGGDLVFGGAGDDTLSGGAGGDQIWGAGGNDSITGGADNDLMGGDEGKDSLYGGTGSDTLWGGAGLDYIEGGDDADEIGGDEGSDTVFAGGGNDTIWEVDGDDELHGDTGNDSIYAESGNDSVYGDAGADTIYAGTGDDYVEGGGDGDQIIYGEGHDTVHGGDGNDTIDDINGDNSYFFANYLTGGGGNDLIYAADDGDTLEGGTGADTLYGEGGGDIMIGGEGDDSLEGGGGADTFAFSEGSGADKITDFDMVDADSDGFTDDRLDITGMTAADGQQAKIWDVSVSDDGFGNALLTFPWGETITLNGVSVAQADSPSEMQSMGVPCYVSGTRIMTPGGEVPVEALRAGDLVATLDHGAMPVLWAGRRHLDAAALDAAPRLCPIRLRDGLLGNRGDLLVSPQHGMRMDRPGGARLLRAVHLERDGDGRARRARGQRSVTYHHLLLPRHALVLANGAPGESLYPGQFALAGFDATARAELFGLFPRLAAILHRPAAVARLYGPPALPYETPQAFRADPALPPRGARAPAQLHP